MTNAWETTNDDVAIVLKSHNITVSEKRLEDIANDLDYEAIEKGVLCFQTMGAQTNSMLNDIEDQLMENGVIPKGDKKFFTTEDDDVDDWDDEEDY